LTVHLLGRLWTLRQRKQFLIAGRYFADSWEKRWKKSTWKTSEKSDGTFKLSAGKWYGDAEDKGIQTDPDARFFAYYSKLDKPYDNAEKDLVFQV
jgi:calreticulin